MPRSAKEKQAIASRTAGRGRRTPSLPRKQRYEQLLAAASAIVGRCGVSALTISALTLEVGVSRPVVYEHFPNAEAIAIALIDDYFTKIIDFVDERTRNAASLDEYLSRAIDAQFEFHRDTTLIVRKLTNGHSASDRLNAAYQAIRVSSVETFSELLQQQGVAPDVAHCAGHAIAEMFLGTVYEFAGGALAETANETLRSMLMGAIHALVPQSRARPSTPEAILRKARDIRQARDS